MKKFNKIAKKIIIFCLFVIFISGCGSDVEVEEELEGTLKLGGSTTVYPFAIEASKVFMEEHPSVNILVSQSSTGEGLVKFLSGEIDIADATRAPTEEEYNQANINGLDVHMTVVSNDAVVVVVHKDNSLRDISLDELYKIFFTGEIKDWSQVGDGSKTGKINVYGTDPAISGTAELFISKVKGQRVFERTSIEGSESIFVGNYEQLHPTPLVVPTVFGDPDGIAYTPLKWVDDSVVLLSVNGVMPDEKSVLDTSYLLSRKMLMITNGIPSGLSREFIRFVLSREGQKIAEEEGFFPVVVGE